MGANVENLTLTGTSNISGTGNSLNNVIIGNSGNNSESDKIQVRGTSSQYQLSQVNLLGSSTLDTAIYYVGGGGSDLVGVVQDSLNVQLNRDFNFV